MTTAPKEDSKRLHSPRVVFMFSMECRVKVWAQQVSLISWNTASAHRLLPAEETSEPAALGHLQRFEVRRA
jgi:hypothetical protein